MRKKLILKIIGIVSAALILLTFTSRTIYGMTLPVVYTVTPRMDTVPVTARTAGMLDSEEASDILAGGDWRIGDVFVNNGDTVEKGSLLFSIDLRELEMHTRNMEINVRDLEISIRSKELDILRLENSIDALSHSTNLPAESEIRAPFDGLLLDVPTVYPAQRLSQGQVLGRFVDDSVLAVSFYFSIAYKDTLKPGMGVSVSLPEWMTVIPGMIESISDDDYIVNGARAVLANVHILNTGTLSEGANAMAEITGDGEERILPIEASVLRYAREDFILAPINGIITQTNLNMRSRFNRDSVLLRMSPEAIQRDDRATQRSLAELTAALELARIQLEAIYNRLELARVQLEQFTYPPDGNIYAEEDGTVFNMSVMAGGRYGLGEKLLSILPEGAPLTVRFTLGAKEGKDFGLDSSVSAVFYTLHDAQTKEQTRNSTVHSRRLSDDGGSWEYTAVIDVYEGSPLMNIGVEVTVGHPGELYFAVVPVAAVTERPDGPRVFVVRSRRGLFGEEFFVSEMNVTVLAGNPFVAALDMMGGFHAEVVTYVSRSIRDGDVVRVEGR
jgi:multidrug resistance efflux pump